MNNFIKFVLALTVMIFTGIVAVFLFLLAQYKEEIWGKINERSNEFDD